MKKKFGSLALLFSLSQFLSMGSAQASIGDNPQVEAEVTGFDRKVVHLSAGKRKFSVPRSTFSKETDLRPGQKVSVPVSWEWIEKQNQEAQ
jgi:hypothetical protein